LVKALLILGNCFLEVYEVALDDCLDNLVITVCVFKDDFFRKDLSVRNLSE
jgi:hypothetical protein